MSTDDTALLILSLMYTPGVGPARVTASLQYLRDAGVDPAQVLAEPAFLREVLTADQLKSLVASAQRAHESLQKLASFGATSVVVDDPRYPRRLSTSLGRKAPPILFCKGNLDLLQAPAVGFCGSRRASERGLEVAADCAGQLAAAGAVVVSGYATGVDLACHSTALKEGGTTVFVLAEGLLGFRVKQAVRDPWDWGRAAVVSEFVPEARWTVANAMQRNRTICGIPNAMILIEAGETGGSIAAGRECLAMKRPLFAPVYEGMPDWATGNRLVLNEGALPLHRSRTTGRANMTRLLEVVRGAPDAAASVVGTEPSPSPPPTSAVRVEQPAVLPLFTEAPAPPGPRARRSGRRA